jgi:hypothetical protein
MLGGDGFLRVLPIRFSRLCIALRVVRTLKRECAQCFKQGRRWRNAIRDHVSISVGTVVTFKLNCSRLFAYAFFTNMNERKVLSFEVIGIRYFSDFRQENKIKNLRFIRMFMLWTAR